MRRHCVHYTRTLLLPRQRRRPRPNQRIWRVPKIARRESHQCRRRVIFRLIESNQRRQSRHRVFSGTHPTKRRRRNCSSALFSVRKRCCGGEDFTEVKATASLDRIWNFRCAHFSRAWVFRPMAGSTWRRWLHSAYCRVNAGAVRWKSRIGVSFPRRNRRSAANGFTRQLHHCARSKVTDCSSAVTVPTKIWPSMRTSIRSLSSEIQMVARLNFRCGSSSFFLLTRCNFRSSLIAL